MCLSSSLYLCPNCWYRIIVDVEPLIGKVAFDNEDTTKSAGFNVHLSPFNVFLVFIQQLFGVCICCCCRHVIHIRPDWRKSALQPLPSNHHWNDELHCHGKRQRTYSAACQYSHFETLPCSCIGLCCNPKLEVKEVSIDQPCEAIFDLKEVEPESLSFFPSLPYLKSWGAKQPTARLPVVPPF